MKDPKLRRYEVRRTDLRKQTHVTVLDTYATSSLTAMDQLLYKLTHSFPTDDVLEVRLLDYVHNTASVHAPGGTKPKGNGGVETPFWKRWLTDRKRQYAPEYVM
jgi:hypothetical protein